MSSAERGHFILLKNHGAFGLFKAHHSRKIKFGRYRNHGQNRRWVARLSRNDQLVEYQKPDHPPAWMSKEEYEQAPQWITVREMKVKVKINGQRKQIVLVTTLLDPVKYPPEDLIQLLGQRWTIETNLTWASSVESRSLKILMGLNQVRCKTVEGVQKELAAYLLVYNVVRMVMLSAARLQKVCITRVSFADALAWVRYNPHQTGPDRLRINPDRPGRIEPRRIKKRNNSFPTMHKPREELHQEMVRKRLVA